MTGLLPDVEGWIQVAGAAVAVLMAILVPVRSWIVEDRRYRAQTLDAIAAASRHAAAGVAGASHALADSLALAGLAEALREVASAVRALTDAGEDRDKDRLTRALEAFLDVQRGPGR